MHLERAVLLFVRFDELRERAYRDRLAALDIERALPVADEEGEVEEVLDRLPEVVRVDDEFEEVDLGVVVL